MSYLLKSLINDAFDDLSSLLPMEGQLETRRPLVSSTIVDAISK